MRSIPFPRVPDSQREKYSANGLTLRTFGTEPEDLVLDLADADRRRVEEGILACCTRKETDGRVDAGFFTELEVGKRTEALLLVMALTSRGELDIQLRCVNPAC